MRAPAAWVRGRVTYRADADGQRPTADLWIAKAVLLEDLPWDLETYRGDNADFPRTSTADQFYGEFDLEAYRVLGREVTRALVADREASAPPAGRLQAFLARFR